MLYRHCTDGCGNIIETSVSGYPINFRNLSNDNKVEDNRIHRSGRISYYRGEFCDTACAEKNEISQQYASWGN